METPTAIATRTGFGTTTPTRTESAIQRNAGISRTPLLDARLAASSPASGISIRKLSKTFRGQTGNVPALQEIDLEIRKGEFVSLLGASGCGKTTLLRIIGGLERSFQGQALLDGNPIPGPGRDRGFVFQDHRLLPWLTIQENVGFGLSSLPRKEREETVRAHLDLVGLSNFARSYPSQVSGGMAQRASIARALAPSPQILLLDEPLGALDALTRMQMQSELERVWKAKPGLTVVMVTHDVDEAIYLSDRIVVLSPRPGTIRRIVDVELARPRLRESYDYNQLKKGLLEDFELSHRVALPEFTI